MSVDRSQLGHQTRYALRDEAGLTCVLTYTADPDEPAVWKILLPGPGGTEDLYGTHQLPHPDPGSLQGWLSPGAGGDRLLQLGEPGQVAFQRA
ncbi:MAG TPA: hypothetical protein VK817_00230 [Trebonia sp.]|jgi:hypothetical protein|nr:hypothetical protein [Trebonia sp.]